MGSGFESDAIAFSLAKGGRPAGGPARKSRRSGTTRAERGSDGTAAGGGARGRRGEYGHSEPAAATVSR
jgi:hypothetical protein